MLDANRIVDHGARKGHNTGSRSDKKLEADSRFIRCAVES